MFLSPEASAVVLDLLLAEELAGATVTATEKPWDQSMAEQGYQREEMVEKIRGEACLNTKRGLTDKVGLSDGGLVPKQDPIGIHPKPKQTKIG